MAKSFHSDESHAGLQTIDSLLSVSARCYKMHIMAVFVDAVTKYLLALLINDVEVVENKHQLLLDRASARAGRAATISTVRGWTQAFVPHGGLSTVSYGGTSHEDGDRDTVEEVASAEDDIIADLADDAEAW